MTGQVIRHPNAPDAEASIEGPVNLSAEQALLGAILYDNEALACIGHYLQPRHFAEPLHGRLFELAKAGIDKGGVVDLILMAEQLAEERALQELGGVRYLADLVEQAPPAANAPDYAKLVFDLAMRRDVVTICNIGSKAARTANDGSAFEVVSEIRRHIEALEHDAAPEDATMIEAPKAAADAIAAMQDLATHGRTRGLMTGLRCVDRRLNGLKPGALVVIGGRPGMGKTALARAIAHGAAVRNPNHAFLFVGVEMGPDEMMQRELSALTHESGDGIEYRAMASGALTPMDFMAMRDAERRVPPNLILDDCPHIGVDDVRRKVWSLSRRRKLGAVFIDYLQLMRRPTAMGRNEASVIAEMTQALKQTARQAGVCIVLLSQLNRGVESRDDKRPMLSDLRESGSIEQDADAVLFPFREHYYLAKQEPKGGGDKHLDWEMRCQDTLRRLDVICAKQRQGPEGTDRQRYFAEFDYIEDDRDA
jgi:replicative DNA helicase